MSIKGEFHCDVEWVALNVRKVQKLRNEDGKVVGHLKYSQDTRSHSHIQKLQGIVEKQNSFLFSADYF